MKEKQFNVVMLPASDGKTPICTSIPHPQLMQPHVRHDNEYWQGQHLYITSDAEIKEGDWYINNHNQVEQCTKELVDVLKKFPKKKIVATTDPLVGNWEVKVSELITRTNKGIPKIPVDLIEYYIDRYNAGEPITTVNLEIEEAGFCRNGVDCNCDCNSAKSCFIYTTGPKLRPDNTVIYCPVQEQVFTREDMQDCYGRAVFNTLQALSIEDMEQRKAVATRLEEEYFQKFSNYRPKTTQSNTP